MVFQNYALYPHMTVRKNLGYGLRVRKTPKKERAQRVERGRALLGLEDLLDRRPGQLSGGQQQRVAMGRAIVREPAALPDGRAALEPRRQAPRRRCARRCSSCTRGSATTTVYVTHDQIEAMTLGQRVAVMQDGRIQQVDPPQRLYEDPANLFVAAFIGSPAMNLVETNVGGDAIGLGGHSIPLDRERRPRFAQDGSAIVGIRPEAFEDAAFAESGLPQIEVRIEVIEELGSDAHLFFQLDGVKPVVIEEAEIARRGRRSAAARGARARPLHRARRLPDEGPRRRHDPARGRPVALLLLLAGDR